MTLDTERTIGTGRSWRDLPPEPPMEDVQKTTTAPPPVLPPKGAPSLPRRRWPWILGAAFLAAGLGVVLVWAPWSGPEEAVPGATAGPATEDSVADVAAALMPSVVQIESRAGVGSGFVYDDSGLIFTAAHVVAGSEEVTVRTNEGQTVTGTVVARDRSRDVAVVAAPLDAPVAAPLGDGDDVRIGETAIAIGSPFGLDQSVTAGIVSGLDRSLTVAGQEIAGLIQTDAAINQGNSGGPLANGFGRVIGINVAIASASGGSNGVGFAVPIDVAMGIAEGVTTDSPPALADELDVFSPLGDLFRDLFDLDSPFGEVPFGDIEGLLDLLDGLGLGVDPLDPDEFGGLLDGFDFGFDFETPGGGTGAAQLFDLGDLPTGYRSVGMQISADGSGTRQVTTVDGPRGSVTVRATTGTDLDDFFDEAPGDAVTVRGREGRLDETATRISLSWVEREMALEVIAPLAVGRDRVMEITEALEVVG